MRTQKSVPLNSPGERWTKFVYLESLDSRRNGLASSMNLFNSHIHDAGITPERHSFYPAP